MADMRGSKRLAALQALMATARELGNPHQERPSLLRVYTSELAAGFGAEQMAQRVQDVDEMVAEGHLPPWPDDIVGQIGPEGGLTLE